MLFLISRSKNVSPEAEKSYASMNKGWFSYKTPKIMYHQLSPLAYTGGTYFLGYTILMDILRHHGHGKRPLILDELIVLPIMTSLICGAKWGVKAA